MKRRLSLLLNGYLQRLHKAYGDRIFRFNRISIGSYKMGQVKQISSRFDSQITIN